MNAQHINHHLQALPPPPPSSNLPISSVIPVTYPPQFYLKSRTACRILEHPLLQAALGATQSKQKQEAIREQSEKNSVIKHNHITASQSRGEQLFLSLESMSNLICV